MSTSVRTTLFRPILAVLFGISLAMPPLSTAQGEAAALQGVVFDPTGAAVQGASVTLTDSRGDMQSTVTGDSGRFAFERVPAGNYQLQIDAPGFATQRVSGASPAAEAGELQIRLSPSMLRQDVTVTATRSETPLSAMPSAVTLLQKESIDQQRAIADDLASVLEKTIPGFGPSMQKMAGRSESFRGRNPLYLINGVPQHNALRDGQRDGQTIELDFVEEVEVIHGSNSLQGIGATGGVINMVTKRPPASGSWRQDMRLALSSHDSFNSDSFAPKGSYLIGKRFGRFDFTGGASLMKRDLFLDANGDPVGLYPTQGDLMDSTQRNYYFHGGFEPADGQRLAFTFNDFRLARDGDYVVALGDRASGRVTSTVPGDPRPVVGDPAENDVTTISLDYNARGRSGDFIAQGFYQNFAALFEGGLFGGFFRLTPDGPPFLDQSEIQSEKYGVKLSYALPERLWEGFTPRVGLDILRDESSQVLARSDREWVPATELLGVAPFVQLEQSLFKRLNLTGGVRVENARVRVGDFVTIASAGSIPVMGGDPTFSEVLPNAGASFNIVGGLSLYGSYSEGFTMPDVGRVLRAVATPGQDVDSLLSIEPVVTNNTEFGARYSAGRLRTRAAYYRSTSSLGSILQADQNGFFNVLRQRTEIDGIELSAEVRATDRLTLGGNYAWIEGEFDSDGDDLVDSDLDGTNVAPNRVNLFAQFYPTSWMNGRLQFSGFLDRDFEGPAAPSNANFGGYGLVDLLLGFPTKYGLIRFGVENLLDRQYLTYFAQTEPFQRNDTIFAGRGRTFTFVFEPRLSFR